MYVYENGKWVEFIQMFDFNIEDISKDKGRSPYKIIDFGCGCRGLVDASISVPLGGEYIHEIYISTLMCHSSCDYSWALEGAGRGGVLR